MDFVMSIIKKHAAIVDTKYFSKKEKRQVVAAKFFSKTSGISSFLLFHNLGILMVSLFVGCCFFYSAPFFRFLVAAFADFSFLEALKVIVTNLPLSFVMLMVFMVVLMDLIVINTFLVECASVNSRIKSIYGNDFIRRRNYNQPGMALKAGGQLSKTVTIGVIGGVIGGTFANVVGELVYKANYGEYIKTATAHPELIEHLKPPKKGFFGFSFK